jgi:hypothetical protein
MLIASPAPSEGGEKEESGCTEIFFVFLSIDLYTKFSSFYGLTQLFFEKWPG